MRVALQEYLWLYTSHKLREKRIENWDHGSGDLSASWMDLRAFGTWSSWDVQCGIVLVQLHVKRPKGSSLLLSCCSGTNHRREPPCSLQYLLTLSYTCCCCVWGVFFEEEGGGGDLCGSHHFYNCDSKVARVIFCKNSFGSQVLSRICLLVHVEGRDILLTGQLPSSSC